MFLTLSAGFRLWGLFFTARLGSLGLFFALCAACFGWLFDLALTDLTHKEIDHSLPYEMAHPSSDLIPEL